MSHILLDTNILTRMAQPGHLHHQIALDAVDKLASQGDDLCIVPQILYEYWVVATRPVTVNGMGMSANEAANDISQIKSLFRLLPDTPRIYLAWEQIVTSLAIIGKNAHDARLVATMSVHSITHLLTFNVGDFSRYSGITILDPQCI